MKIRMSKYWCLAFASLVIFVHLYSTWFLMPLSYSALKTAKPKPVAHVIANQFSSTAPSVSPVTWPLIMNLSLIAAGNVYVGGWVIKGESIVMSALFPEDPSSFTIRLQDAHGLHLQCSSHRTSAIVNIMYMPALIMCGFFSASDMNQRMNWSPLTSISAPPCTVRCSNASASTVVVSIHAIEIHVPRLEPFPSASAAIVLPVLHNDINPLALSRWIAHNRMVLGVELLVVYSLNSQLSFDRDGLLASFYESGTGVVIVNAPQLGRLKSFYRNQHFVINDALLRGIGAVSYIGRCALAQSTACSKCATCRSNNYTHHTSHVAPHMSHLTCHTSHVTPHTSHLTPHSSHLTPHTSHLTPHASHLTPHT